MKSITDNIPGVFNIEPLSCYRRGPRYVNPDILTKIYYKLYSNLSDKEDPGHYIKKRYSTK